MESRMYVYGSAWSIMIEAAPTMASASLPIARMPKIRSSPSGPTISFTKPVGGNVEPGLLGGDPVLDDRSRADLPEPHHHQIDEANSSAGDPCLQPESHILKDEEEDDQQDDPTDNEGTECNWIHRKHEGHDVCSEGASSQSRTLS